MGFNLQLPHLAQGLNGVDIYKQGLELGDLWLERKKNAELAKIERDTQDIDDSSTRFEKMIGLAKQSKRSKWLIDDINAMQSAQAQAELANREKMAGIDHKISETNKNNATATDTMAGVAKKRMDMTNPLYEVLAGSGSLDMGRSFLKNRHTYGAIDDEQYQALLGELDSWSGLTPDEIKAYSFGLRKGDLPVDVLHQTADNRADNETKFDIAKMDNNTRFDIAKMDNNTKYDIAEMQDGTERYKTDQNNATERWKTQAGIDHDNSLIDENYKLQQQAIRDGKAQIIEVDGRMYLDFGNDQYLPYISKDGKPVTPAPKPESRADKEKRQMEILNLEQSYEQTQQSIDFVDKVSNAFSAIGKSNGLLSNGVFAAKSQIPGTDEHALMGHIETLKSKIFLTQVENMRGLGALTDTEGKKLESAIASLNPYSKDFATSLGEIKTTLDKAKQRMAQKQAVYEQADFDNAFF